MMTIRNGMILALAVLAPVIAASMPPPPTSIASRVSDGRFDPGDYGWLRGMFAGSSAAEQAEYRAVVDWRRRCRSSDMEETRAELTALGVRAGSALETIPYRSLACDQVATLPEPLDLGDWATFQRNVALVRPIADAYLAALSAAESSAPIDSRDLRDALNARRIGEQVLRSGLSWADERSAGNGSGRTLTLQQGGILKAMLATALAARDHANTAWLKGVVKERGWPRRTQVGEEASRAAWLLIQHADADPAFQMHALRLMEPLVPAGEVDSRKHASLYDRVALKISGRQRFATQLTCRAGRYVPQALEDERGVDERRRGAGLDPLAVFQARVLKDMGPCTERPHG